MMLASCVDLRWSNLPLRAIFLPYLHQTVRHLAIRSEKKTAYVVGQTLAVAEGWQIKDPAGKVYKEGQIIADLPGFYVASESDGEFCYAVNTSAAEADSAVLQPQEIKAAAQRVAGEVGDVATEKLSPENIAAAAEKADERQGIWWYLIVATGLLLFGELTLANRTLRH